MSNSALDVSYLFLSCLFHLVVWYRRFKMTWDVCVLYILSIVTVDFNMGGVELSQMENVCDIG